MPRRQPIIEVGTRYGRLVVVGEPFMVSTPTEQQPGRRDLRYPCRCDCGLEVTPSGSNLRSGNNNSCGCVRREKSSAFMRTLHFKHGGSCGGHSPEYEIWCGIMKRCRNEKCVGYPNYGGRGITVCERWAISYPAFLADMGRKPAPALQIDRIDNEGGYWCGQPECPECGPLGREPNCRWATRTAQNENRRSCVTLEYNGQSMIMKGWCQLTGMNKSTLSYRIRKGWSVEEAITTPAGVKRKAQ